MKTSHLIIITIATLLAGIVIICAIVALPSLTGIIKLYQTIGEEQARIEKIIGRALKLHQTTENIETLKKALPNLEKMLIKDGHEIELFTLLSDKSRAYELTETLRLGITEITPAQTKILPLDIELKGTFINTLRFIADIEQSEIALPFYSIDFRIPAKSENPKQLITTTLKGTVYVQQ